VNTVTPSVGFSALELNAGSEPFSWFWDSEGHVLNPPAALAERAASTTYRSVETLTSDDGYEFVLDLRWRSERGERFHGPVLLMVYGAYGLDIDLDVDRDLGRWLDRGFAVGTPHVRGGGRGPRHLAGCRANRGRSLADLHTAVRWLRSGQGAVTAARLCVLGASAGGFLAATTLNTCPDDIDACVIVNGFVDPLTSLLRQDTTTIASDQDEWGNPLDNLKDLQALQEVSPVDNLRSAGTARALVVVAGRDVRVNPRQGLKWYLDYRALGGEATLWYDPNGAHDCWGADMNPDAMVDWVCDALAVAR
jgi:protease II